MKSFTNKDGELRLYEGSASTWYLPIRFTGADFSGPLGRNRPEETLILDRQTLDCNTHLIETSDARIVEPAGLSFSCRMYNAGSSGLLLDMLSGRTVNSKTMVTTKGTTQNDGANDNPVFLDTSKKAFNVEIKWAGSDEAGNDLSGASYENLVFKYNETFFDLGDQTITEAEDGVTLSLSGLVYGTIVSAAGSADDFTTGNNVASPWDCA